MSYEGSDRRIRDLSVPASAKVVAHRIIDGDITVEEAFTDTGTPEANLVRGKDLVGGELREKVGGVLRKALVGEEITETLDEEEVKAFGNIDEFVDDHYAESLSDFKPSGFYDSENPREGGEKPPSMAKVKELLFEHLTPYQLSAIKQMGNPVLQLIPVTSGDCSLKALNSHKPLGGQEDVGMSTRAEEMLKIADERDGVSGDKIIGWKIAITEGVSAPDILEGDDIKKLLEERLKWFEEEYGSKGVSGVDFNRYNLLQITRLAKTDPRPLDDDFNQDGTCTILNGEPVLSKDSELVVASGGCVVVKRWGLEFRRIYLSDIPVNSVRYDARFRLSVVIDVT